MKCPFCQGEISDSAVRCRHCQKSLYPSSYGQESSAVRKPPAGADVAPPVTRPGVAPPPAASAPPAPSATPPATEPPRRTGFVGGPPRDWTPGGTPAPPPPPPAGEPQKRSGFVGGPPKDWTPGDTPAPPPPPPAGEPQKRSGFVGGPPKDWTPGATPVAPPPPPAGEPQKRNAFVGGPPKDWTPGATPVAPPPPPAGEPQKRNAFVGGPPKDWNPESPAPPSAEPPRRSGFGGGPPRDWKPEGDDGAASGAPPSSAGGADQSLWAFAQDMPAQRDERIGDEAERQRQAQRQSILDDIRDRADGINRALDAELPEQVLRMAYDLKDYICDIRRDDDPEIDAELEKVQTAIDRLEKAGYSVSGPLDGLRENALSISKSTMKWFAFAVLVVGLVVWGVYALIKADEAENAKMPGRITGTVSIDNAESIPIRVGFENVRLVQATDGAKVLADKLAAYKNKAQAFAELKEKRGGLPAVMEATTNTVGQFQFDKVPPGKYYVIVLTQKNEEIAGAWMVPIPVEPTKITDVNLAEVNRLK